MSPDPTFNPDEAVGWNPSPPRGYALSGKIMLSAIVFLFVVVLLMVLLHIYARWYLLQARRRHLLHRLSQQRRRRHHHQRTNLVFYVDNQQPSSASGAGGGLEASVLAKLPVFVFSSRTSPEPMECAVCLSEFDENEQGRVLPKCKHSFHSGCIDMWFLSHSTCPLCRSPVEPLVESPQEISIPVSIAESEECGQPSTGSSSEMCATCQHEEAQSSSTSVAARRKGLDMVAVRIELPRSESEFELSPSSSASQGYRSPGTRLLSLKRILSMNKRIGCSGGVGPTGAGVSTPTAVTELDLEKGIGESTQERTRAHSPVLLKCTDNSGEAIDFRHNI